LISFYGILPLQSTSLILGFTAHKGRYVLLKIG